MALRRLDHVLVLAQDMDGTRDFYRDVLGLREGSRPPLAFPGYWLYAEDIPCVHIADREAYEAHARGLGMPVAPGVLDTGPVDHVAFNADDYDEILAAVQRSGTPVRTNTVPGIGLRQLFLHDPNGVRVEINVAG
jgi:catechol 2,3-dioxygenase-like lactoylglutathione lyase family enzyme